MQVVSSAFKDKPELDAYWHLMDEADLKRLSSSPLVEIGSHGHFHNNYASISTYEVSMDLLQSKQYLEEVIDQEVTLLAYPDGSYTKEVVNLAEEVGYHFQFSTGSLYPEGDPDLRIHHRLGINPYIGQGYHAKAMIDGFY